MAPRVASRTAALLAAIAHGTVAAAGEAPATPVPGREHRVAVKLDPRAFQVAEGPSDPAAVYYEVVEEGGQVMLRGTYRPGLDTVVMGVRVPDAAKDRALQVRWRWRVRAFPVGGDECFGPGDSAASVLVTFKRGLRWYILKYVWSPLAPLGATCDRKRTLLLNRDTIVLERGGATGRWLHELVDVHQAFIDHFAGGDRNAKVPDLVGIGIMTDGDQTHSASGADWADFEVLYAPPP